MRLRRLARMEIRELADRGRQAGTRWWDRTGLPGSGPRRAYAPLSDIAPGLTIPVVRERVRGGDLEGAGALLWQAFLDHVSGRFFAGASDLEEGAIAGGRGGDAGATVVEAESLLAGRFDLLGYRALSFGDPVDWWLDPRSGRRAPPLHWSQLDPLNPLPGGDPKVIWELNRHQWMVTLGRAFVMTGDERYATAFADHLTAWLRTNPPGVGINWASSLEVALRLISWCWALVLFRGSAALTPALVVSALSAVRSHAAHIEHYMSHYFSPNTHLTGEALGLFYAGVTFPQLRSAGRWRAAGASALSEEIDRQVHDDGVYVEQSTCYQRYTVEIYLHFLILSARAGQSVPAGVKERVQRMLDFLLHVRRPDGSMPEIGDADGGSLLPLAARDPGDLRGVFSTAAALFGRGDYAWASGEIAPETLWLLGTAGRRSFAALLPAPPAGEPSRRFPSGGQVVMRSGWRADARHLLFDAGPIGGAGSAGHGHGDLLSVQCSAFGEHYLVDPGTYAYHGERRWRDFFRGTSAHSTLLVDGMSQAIPDGPFGWKSRPEARLRRWVSNDTLDFADAEHDAYRLTSDPLTHRRRVLFVKPHCWVLVDDLDGKEIHRVEIRFQFAPMRVRLDPIGAARAYGPNGSGLLVHAAASTPLSMEVRSGETDPIEGWVSSRYGVRDPAPVLILTAVARLPFRAVTVLVPLERSSAPGPEVAILPGADGLPSRVVFGRGREAVTIDADAVTVSGG